MNIPGLFLKRSTLKHGILVNRLFATVAEEKIEIPKRIPRGPTDILRALESTISRDPTAAHYKYHDDPYLIPNSNLSKRTYALAKESGRKAAHWVREQNPELFNHRECEPPIETFFPKMVFTENSEVTEQDLINVIDKHQVSDAVLIHRLLKAKGVEISEGSRQSLLELLCYYNGEDALNEEFTEERWFKQSSRLREKQRKTWKDGNVAEEIFISIDNPTSEAYCAIIQGMAKYYQVDRAMHLFEEAQQKGISLNVDTYNSLIAAANFLKESYELRWTFMNTMLENMKQAGLKPNLGSLNAILHTLSTMGSSKTVKQNALKVLREFKELGIEPCLGSWNHILNTYCKERGPRSAILKSILNQVEHQSHEIRDVADTNFFVTAMGIARNHVRDITLGERVHRMLLLGNNYNLLGDSYKESVYYRHYLSLNLASVPLEDFMEHTYNKLVPNIYVPEPAIMEDILQQVDLNGLIEYIPKLWSDMTIFDHTRREKMVDLILQIMVNNEPPQDSHLVERFSNIAWDIYTSIEEQQDDKFSKISFTGDLLGNILILVLRNNDFEKGCTVMDKLDRGQNTIVGVPKFESLALFVDHCIKNKSPFKAITCIQYASDSGFPDAVKLGAKLDHELTLDEDHLNKLSKIVNLAIK